jgi:hypothetical protein
MHVNSLPQRRNHPNVGLVLCILWCAGVWLAALYFTGVLS